MPLAISLLFDVDVEFDVVFDFIVLGVGAACGASATGVAFFVVSEVGCSEDTTLAEIPVDQLLTEVIVH